MIIKEVSFGNFPLITEDNGAINFGHFYGLLQEGSAQTD